jgi:hypothetical protein
LLEIANTQKLKNSILFLGIDTTVTLMSTKRFCTSKDWIAAYPQFSNIELHITEWGHDSDIDPGYDGAFAQRTRPRLQPRWLGKFNADLVEIQDGRSGDGKEYWGRWGLFTHQDFGAKAKPRYRALKFIDDNIGTQRVSILGKGSWVKAMAARSGDATTVVLANYDSSNRHNENVPVTFKNVIGEKFAVDTIFMDGRSNRTEISNVSRIQVVVSMP